MLVWPSRELRPSAYGRYVLKTYPLASRLWWQAKHWVFASVTAR
jgi:hypothetical protein